jgi:hypothetical protein
VIVRHKPCFVLAFNRCFLAKQPQLTTAPSLIPAPFISFSVPQSHLTRQNCALELSRLSDLQRTVKKPNLWPVMSTTMSHPIKVENHRKVTAAVMNRLSSVE